MSFAVPPASNPAREHESAGVPRTVRAVSATEISASRRPQRALYPDAYNRHFMREHVSTNVSRK